MANCKSVSTPFDPNQKLTKKDQLMSHAEASEMRKIPYREAIGSLLYASQGTRPDIAYAVGLANRFCQDPRRLHWTAVKRIFRYLKGTLSTKLVFNIEANRKIEGYNDSDCANDADHRNSITGSIFLFQGGPISWQSKKQRTVALFTTEAEYIALSSTAQEALWLRVIAKELDPDAVLPVTIFCNNKGAIDLAKNTGYRPRTKT
ncbi:secreted RxLR effector protein 161-like [Vespa mandarinia]|uniref:secreted RxLR effector protein 161-like n=1 Tax=Vespa mandarinia TaxID=7446 RepID=UPI00160A5263|nr:secreted RxLR effector protein 161-like [Vespa mandarinia]